MTLAEESALIYRNIRRIDRVDAGHGLSSLFWTMVLCEYERCTNHTCLSITGQASLLETT